MRGEVGMLSTYGSDSATSSRRKTLRRRRRTRSRRDLPVTANQLHSRFKMLSIFIKPAEKTAGAEMK